MPNSELVREAVERAIKSFDPIRTGDTDIHIEVENGTVTLYGYVRTGMMRNVASQLAASVLSGREVRNALISDDDLEITIATAIEEASEGYLAPVPIQVRVLRGHCVLRGPVPSESAKEEIERIIYGVPGVLEVANALDVDPGAIERLLAPKRAGARKKRAAGGVAEATVGGKPVTAADLPAWALKPKEEWTKADYQARAEVKMAFKRGEGPDPKELEQAGALLRGGARAPAEDTTLAEAEGATGLTAQPPELVEVPAAAEMPPALVTDSAPPSPVVTADTSNLPSWALKPKEQWSKEEFQAHAKARSAFKKGEGPNPDDLIAQGQAALATAPSASSAAVQAEPTVDLAALEARYPAWALKPKEEWTPADFKAQAAAKSAFKKGEGPDPKTIIEEAQAALSAAKAPSVQTTVSAGPQDSAEAALAAVRAQYPGWALKPRREWTAQDFREAAEAKVAEIRAHGQPVGAVRAEAQAALEAARRGEVTGTGSVARTAKRDLTPDEIAQVRAGLTSRFPEWALKPKEEWAAEDFKAQASAKSAFKKGEGPDPKTIIEEAQAAFEKAKAEAFKNLPAEEVQPATAAPPPDTIAREIPPELLGNYPAWALKPKEQWSPDEFKAHAKAKSAFKKGEGPDPEALMAEAQSALAAVSPS
ncbi:MAG: BON domain-containing protein [Ardenticatenaceae bacterium]|nr:BON domain-containing protein [Ardenticatenaceae bacterium]